jgi:hypothetical protein
VRPRQLITIWFRRSSSARVERFAILADPRPRIRDRGRGSFPHRGELPPFMYTVSLVLAAESVAGALPGRRQADRAALIPLVFDAAVELLEPGFESRPLLS